MIMIPIQWLILTLAIVVAILIFEGRRSPHLQRLAWRHVRQRPTQTVLIIAGLMVTTVLVVAASTVGTTLIDAVKRTAIDQVGRVDEIVDRNASDIGLFSSQVTQSMQKSQGQNAQVSSITGVILLNDTLIVDETAQQVRGNLNVLGMPTDQSSVLTNFADEHQRSLTMSALAPDEALLTSDAAALLGASQGDSLALYSVHWPGEPLRLHMHAIVTGGPLGRQPTLILPLATLQAQLQAPDQINQIYVANAGTLLTSVQLSKSVANQLRGELPKGFRIRLVKSDALDFALRADDLFGRILNLYTFFALSIDALLIFLIFSLLAIERRKELGTLRALGLQHREVAEVLLFEAALYNGAAALPGMGLGVLLGYVIVALINPAVATLGFPLEVHPEVSDLFTAIWVGFMFSLLVTWLTAWLSSRASISTTLRGEGGIVTAPTTTDHAPQIIWQQIQPRQLVQFALYLLRESLRRGIALLILGIICLLISRNLDSLLGAIGVALIIVGSVGLARWLALWRKSRESQMLPERNRLDALMQFTQQVNHLSALAIGSLLLLFWGLPIGLLGRGRFGRIEVFFVAGLLMVLGVVLALSLNLKYLLTPLRGLLMRRSRWPHIIAVSLMYPTYQRFRTGLSLALFGIVCFIMVVMASIATSTSQRFSDIPVLAGGYDIIGRSLSQPLGNVTAVQSILKDRDPATSANIAAMSSATSIPLGMIQPGGNDAAWRLYPAAAIDGAFLRGSGLPLVARAEGFSNDDEVWKTLQSQPGDVVIDSGALSPEMATSLGIQQSPLPLISDYAAPPFVASLQGQENLEAILSRPDTQAFLQSTPAEVRQLLSQPERLREFTLQLDALSVKNQQFQPVSLWIDDFRSPAPAQKVNIIGIVDNVQGQRFGLLGSQQTFAPLEQNLPIVGNQYFYFQLKPGLDASVVARTLGTDLLKEGFETTPLRKALTDLNAPRVFASEVLLRLVGLMLLVGTVALMITGLRNVAERRQQIGMLRALGFHPWHVQVVFLIETLLVACGGVAVGLFVGLLLCRNAFTLTFLDEAQVGLILVIPWGGLVAILLIAVSAATLAVIPPAWQGSRIAPAEALRYE